MNYQNTYQGAAIGHAGLGAGQATTGYIQDANPVAAPRFEQIANSFANLPSPLYDAVSRLRKLADRYGGSQPEAVAKEANPPPSNNLAAQLESSAHNIEALISQLHEQIARLERF